MIQKAFAFPSIARRFVLLSLVVALVPGVAPTAADEFPPVTDAERALESVPFEPEASAVVLSETARLRFLRYPTEASSRLEVQVRMKILREEGKEFAEILIPHSRMLRLDELEGRTVLPDGTVVPLGEDDIFVERRSRARRNFVTKAAFPAVEVGAILDYRYTFFWDTFLYLDPWLFHGGLPKLRSEITYVKPDNLAVGTWGKETGAEKFEFGQEKTPHGVELSVAMDNLPSLPDEPFGFPFTDLSSRFMVIPHTVVTSGVEVDLLESWRSVCEIFENQIYTDFEKGDRSVKRLARDLVEGAKSDRERAEILYRYVRDEIRTLDFPGVWLASERADDVVENRQGNMADQALVLRTMLDAVGIDEDDARPTWIGHRDDGLVDPGVANPSWFRGTVLRVELDGETVFLDPSDPTLAFGTLAPGHEGSVAVACDTKEPEVLNLGASPASANRRRAELDLALDDEGRVGGTGELVYTGHAAWSHLGTVAPDDLVEHWEERLENRIEGFDVSEVEVTEEIESRRFVVRFALAQRDEEVLGDEASVWPSAPLAESQPFTLPPNLRRGPVMFDYASSEENTVTVRWPEGWQLENRPETVDHAIDGGGYHAEVTVDEEARTLRYERSFTRDRFTYVGDEAYSALRDLHDAARTGDARALVWILGEDS